MSLQRCLKPLQGHEGSNVTLSRHPELMCPGDERTERLADTSVQNGS
jgi:hypothetical protein